MDQKFLELVESSERIFVCSHYAPDPDAVCSALLLAAVIRYNYPAKAVQVVLEDQPRQNISTITDYDTIKFQPLLEGIKGFKPDFFIMTDVDEVARLTHSNEATEVWDWLRSHNVKTCAVNHHDPAGKDDLDAYINTRTMAAVEEVYHLCFTRLGMQKPEGYNFTILLGIVADSDRFRYHMTEHYRQTFEVVSDLLDAGERIEVASTMLDRYPEEALKVVANLAGNLAHKDDYTYSFVDDAFTPQFVAGGGSISYYRQACRWFVDQFIRSTDDRSWGFTVTPDPQARTGTYGVSFRSVSGTKDLLPLAKSLGGGGHPFGCGASVKASTVQEAVQKVMDAISRQPA